MGQHDIDNDVTGAAKTIADIWSGGFEFEARLRSDSNDLLEQRNAHESTALPLPRPRTLQDRAMASAEVVNRSLGSQLSRPCFVRSYSFSVKSKALPNPAPKLVQFDTKSAPNHLRLIAFNDPSTSIAPIALL